MNVSFLDIASLELHDAFEYYEYQQENLGRKFVFEVENAIECITYYPHAWHNFSKQTRRCLVKNFPYGIIYRVSEDHNILIIAVMNLHRKPNYWTNRLQ